MRCRNTINSKITTDSHVITSVCMHTLVEAIVVHDSASKEKALEVEMAAEEK